MVLINSSDGSNVYDARGGKLEEMGRCRELKVVKLCSVGHFLFTCSDTFAVGCTV